MTQYSTYINTHSQSILSHYFRRGHTNE